MNYCVLSTRHGLGVQPGDEVTVKVCSMKTAEAESESGFSHSAAGGCQIGFLLTSYQNLIELN